MNIKKILFLLLHLGWLFPKIDLGILNLGIQEISGVIIIVFFLKIETSFLKIFFLEIAFAFMSLVIGLSYFVFNHDYYGLFLGIRLLVFTLALLSIEKDCNFIEDILKYCAKVCFLFVLFSIIAIIISFGLGGFNIFDFLYGSGYNKIRAPFEGNNAASSQIPMGILLALLSIFPNHIVGSFQRKVFVIGTFLSTSRAAILGYVSAIIINRNTIFIYKSLIIIMGASFIYFKTYLQGGYSNTLDGSTNLRLELYLHAIKFYSENPVLLLLGNGIGSKSLMENTGYGFYESSIINSLMQGGIILMLLIVFIFIRNLIFDRKYNLGGISILLLAANTVGGDNYFSMYSYPITMTFIIYQIKFSNHTKDK